MLLPSPRLVVPIDLIHSIICYSESIQYRDYYLYHVYLTEAMGICFKHDLFLQLEIQLRVV